MLKIKKKENIRWDEIGYDEIQGLVSQGDDKERLITQQNVKEGLTTQQNGKKRTHHLVRW